MYKKLFVFALFLFIMGLVGDQITTRMFLQYQEEPEGTPNTDENNSMIEYPPLWERKTQSPESLPEILPKLKLNTWMVYDIAIACFASLVTFALLSQSESNDYIRLVMLVFLFFILVSATLKFANTMMNIKYLLF